MAKLAIITTHPIQYYAPLFKLLSERGKIVIKVFYTWSQAKEKKYDPDFDKNVAWDIPLLEGYNYSFVSNISAEPGSHHFKGIDNPSLIQEIKDWSPDALLVFGWSFKSNLKVLRYFKGKVPVYFRGDSTLLDEQHGFSVKKILRRTFLTWVYKHIDVAFYVGEANKEYYLKHGLSKSKLIYAPHAIDNDRFTNASNATLLQQCLGWRFQNGIAIGDIVFLFVGKFSQKKDPLSLLNAFNMLKAKNCWLLFVGNGVLESKLKQSAEGRPNILFMDFQNQSQMPFVYSIGDVFVLPSVGPGETWGLSINEAMACTKPVIVSDKCGGAKDLVVKGVNGFVFKAGNTEQLVDCLNAFASKEVDRIRMGQASYSMISQFSYLSICKAIENQVTPHK